MHGGQISDKGYEYHDKKDRIFNPNDDFTIEGIEKFLSENPRYGDVDKFLKIVVKRKLYGNFFWPKQITQFKEKYNNSEK